MHNQTPSSISQLMLHLSRKYTQTTLDSPRRDLDLWGAEPNNSEICPDETSHLDYSPIDNSYFLEGYATQGQRQKMRTPKQNQQIQTNYPIQNKYLSKNQERANTEDECYTRKLQKMNRALKNELIAVRELMREQSDLIHELYSSKD